jgi:molybdate transport system regulatory protein
MAKLTIRIDITPSRAIGPGKIRLLEWIERSGSISAAGRAMKMSYRRAWLLTEELNRTFTARVVVAAPGGKAGGGANLTPMGRKLVTHYRAMEKTTERVLARHLIALDRASSPHSRKKPAKR